MHNNAFWLRWTIKMHKPFFFFFNITYLNVWEIREKRKHSKEKQYISSVDNKNMIVRNFYTRTIYIIYTYIYYLVLLLRPCDG